MLVCKVLQQKGKDNCKSFIDFVNEHFINLRHNNYEQDMPTIVNESFTWVY